MITVRHETNRISFVAAIQIPASAEAVFDWHEAPRTFERLTPPGMSVRELQHEGCQAGAKSAVATLRLEIRPT